MFKTGFLLIILGMTFSFFLPPRFSGWERKDWLSTLPFGVGVLLILLSFIAAGWKYLP